MVCIPIEMSVETRLQQEVEALGRGATGGVGRGRHDRPGSRERNAERFVQREGTNPTVKDTLGLPRQCLR
jgi:hypothetical protein